MSYQRELLSYLANIIIFKDINLKELLLADSTINPDGTREITYDEAKSSSITGAILKAAINPSDNNTDIVSFEEFKYFTGLDAIATETFSGCSNLKEISFPPAFEANDNNLLLSNTAVEVLHLEGFTTILSKPVTAQNSNSKFGYLPSLKEVWIPDLTTVSYSAFSAAHQPNIEKIIISSVEQWLKIQANQNSYNSLPSAGGKASLYLTSDLEHPVNTITTLSQAISGVTTVPTVFAYSIAGLKNITSIVIGAQNTAVENGAFKDLPNTVTITNFSYITSVGENSFYNCKAQGTETFPSGISSVFSNSFRESALTKVESNSLTSISGANSFRESSITSVKIDNCSVGTGAQHCFYLCTSLTTISANSMSYIPQAMCSDCTNLVEASFTSATAIISNAFYYCSKLAEIDAPNVTTVGKYAFFHCDLLEESNISFNLKELVKIQEAAFANCPEITCPYDFLYLDEIGEHAFSGCKAPSQRYVIFRYQGVVKYNLASVVAQQYSLGTFGSTTAQITTIYVPYGNLTIDGVTKTYLEWYQLDTFWSEYVSRNNLTLAALDSNGNVPT